MNAHGASLRGPQQITPPVSQSLAVLEQAQFSPGIEGDMTIGADPPAAARRHVVTGRKDPVAQVSLCRRAEPCDRPARGEIPDLSGIHVRGVDEAPARVELLIFQASAPVAGPTRGGSRQLLVVVCHMNVNGRFRIKGSQAGYRFPQLFGRYGSQGMRSTPSAASGSPDVSFRKLSTMRKKLFIWLTIASALAWLCSSKATVGIKNRRGRPCPYVYGSQVALPISPGSSGSSIERDGGNGTRQQRYSRLRALQIAWAAMASASSGPRRCTKLMTSRQVQKESSAAASRQTRHGSLEGVTMEVGHPWQQRSEACSASSAEALHPGAGSSRLVHLKEYIFGPSIGKKGRRGKKSCYP